MSKNSFVIFCTRCREFIPVHFYPLPYRFTCPFCGYKALLRFRRKCVRDPAFFSGLLVVTLASEAGNKLLKLSEEKKIVVRAIQK